nr:PREDICTED: WNT1-inducible-signaling pathway protein 2 [Opisthocomus hoazin]
MRVMGPDSAGQQTPRGKASHLRWSRSEIASRCPRDLRFTRQILLTHRCGQSRTVPDRKETRRPQGTGGGRPTIRRRVLFLSLLCILSKVCAQLCRRPCYCPWVPPRCPRGSPLVLDGCVEASEEGCELNGRVYRDGEVFQPSCKLQCRCLDGGFTCVPLCQEDVRLPTLDCPYPRRVEVPGKCCPEWICEARDRHLLRDAGAVPGAPPLSSNQTRYCRLETQRRLCMARPCPALPAASPAGYRQGYRVS